MAVHETVAEPEPLTLVGLNDPQDKPGEGVMLNVTVPANPSIVATVAVEAGDWPALTAVGDIAAIVKSWNRRMVVAE